MRLKSAVVLVPALALGLLAVAPAGAQQHKATRLGNPATRFSKPLKKPDDVRVLVRGDKTKADVAAVLNEAGWKGSLEDLDRAAASAEITVVQMPPGTRIPFMASRKNHKAHALIDVLWAGRKPINAFTFEFSSSCVRYRFQVPHACGNFWIEEIGKDTTDPKCTTPPPPPPPVVSLSGASSACVTQPVEFTVNVQNPPADGKVTLSVNGRDLTTGSLTNGTFKTTFPGAQGPGTYEVKATSGGRSASANVEVKACVPTCGLTASPIPAKAGKPITVNATGSHVAPGVAGGVKTVAVEVVQKGVVVDKYEMAAPNYTRDIVIKKGGMYTIRAIVTDDAGQTSSNTCQADLDVKSEVPLFVGAYGGKQRLFQDNYPGGRCAGLIGLELGFQPMIADQTQLEIGVGPTFNTRDSGRTSMFADLAVNRVLDKGFFGGGLSFWDLTLSDTRSVALLLQGGFDLSKNGKWQLVGQARGPFNHFSDLSNNYQIWGGLRFAPNREK